MTFVEFDEFGTDGTGDRLLRDLRKMVDSDAQVGNVILG